MEGREKVYFTTEETIIYPKSLGIYLKSSYFTLMKSGRLLITLLHEKVQVYWLLYELLRQSTVSDEYLK